MCKQEISTRRRYKTGRVNKFERPVSDDGGKGRRRRHGRLLVFHQVSTAHVYLIPKTIFCFVSYRKEEEEPGFVLAQKPEDDYYKMDNPRRGVALIFNQMNFTNPECPPRDGTNKDRDDLAKLYANFGFEVMIHDDLNAAEIYDVLDTGR